MKAEKLFNCLKQNCKITQDHSLFFGTQFCGKHWSEDPKIVNRSSNLAPWKNQKKVKRLSRMENQQGNGPYNLLLKRIDFFEETVKIDIMGTEGLSLEEKFLLTSRENLNIWLGDFGKDTVHYGLANIRYPE